ncbi:MAG: 50S ribosomal protein L28 [Christensenellales bacterium]|jgi:large subunit ribosomal protein L28|nr:50S ribosomal protein L28 [Clostridiales bacterium]
MSRVCSICGKGPMSGNQVSHSNRKTRRTWSANIHKVKIMKENGAVTKEYVCARCIKTRKKSS